MIAGAQGGGNNCLIRLLEMKGREDVKKAVAARKNTYEKDDRALGFLILMRGLFLSVLPRRAVQPWEALITKKRVKRFLGLTANRRNSLPSRQTIGCGTTSRIPSLLEKMLFPQPLGQLC